MFGALPANAQAQEGHPDRFARHQVVRQALGETDLGGEVQRPQARGMAEVAGAAVQERPQLLGAVVGEGPWWRLVRT